MGLLGSLVFLGGFRVRVRDFGDSANTVRASGFLWGVWGAWFFWGSLRLELGILVILGLRFLGIFGVLGLGLGALGFRGFRVGVSRL